MKVSLNWAQEFSNTPLLDEGGASALVDRIGSQLGAVEETVDYGVRYKGVVVARVNACAKHPDADKLSVCTIDDGGITPDVKRDEQGYVQVVCGAPNVREGLSVAWLPPGATVPSSFGKEPFVLEAREIRGQVSNGMLASPKELGFSDNHDGILEIEEEVKPGTPLTEVFALDDTIIDIENKMFTHRPDCFGQLGVARELAGIQGKAFISPEWYLQDQTVQCIQDESVKDLEVKVEVPELVPRYMAAVLSGISVQPSPAWLQTTLSRVGIRPINNVVDMTNYIMMLTGQPIHAFDFDKVAHDGTSATIVVRKPRQGESVTLLDGKTFEPRADAVLICDNDKPIALGGIMGGNNSEIDENTTRIIIECASFDMYNIRKTSMEHGLFTDASSRFNKGQSEWQNPQVLHRAIRMTQDLLPGVQLVHEVVDVHTPSRQNQPVEVTARFINERLGLTLQADEIATLLRNVEFSVEVAEAEAEKLTVTAPFWRTDIEIPEDIVEEAGRLYGYDRLPLELPTRSAAPATRNQTLDLRQKIRETLAKAGATEVMTYSFVHGKLLEKTGQDAAVAFSLSNALSPELQYYRLSLTPGLLDKVQPNIRADYVRGENNEFALFEIGTVHGKTELDEDGLPREFGRVALVIAADDKTASRNYAGSPYYSAVVYLEYLQTSLGLQLSLMPLSEADFGGHQLMNQMKAPFEPARSAAVYLGDSIVGVVGEYTARSRQTLKLPDYSAGFEVFLSVLGKGDANGYNPLSVYPKVQQDVCFKVPAAVTYKQVVDVVAAGLLQAETDHGYSSVVRPVDIYQKADDMDHKQITLRIWLSHYGRTLTNDEVSTVLDGLASSAAEALQAERV